MAEGNHSFTEQDIRKRFGVIVGHTVTEVDTAGVLTASAASRNKGRIGAVIEQSVLGYPADSDRDRNDMSVVELIELGEKEAESRDLVVWRYGYMDPYEGEIDTAKYSKEQIITTLFPNA